jgi:hypothetical protein
LDQALLEPPASLPPADVTATTPRPPRRSAARRFFGVPARPQTWLNLIYLLLSFPLGIFYFSLFVSLLPTGLGTVIVWIGIPILLLTAAIWWVCAAFERYLADGLLGTHLAPSPQPWRHAQGVWPRIKAHFGAAATWKDLAFIFAKFPLGIVSFVVVVVSLAVPAALVSAPLTVNWADWAQEGGAQIPPDQRGFYFESWHVTTAVEALVFVPFGILTFFVGLWVINGMAAVSRAAAKGLLETARPDEAAARAPAGPVPPVAPRPPPPPRRAPASATRSSTEVRARAGGGATGRDGLARARPCGRAPIPARGDDLDGAPPAERSGSTYAANATPDPARQQRRDRRQPTQRGGAHMNRPMHSTTRARHVVRVPAVTTLVAVLALALLLSCAGAALARQSTPAVVAPPTTPSTATPAPTPSASPVKTGEPIVRVGDDATLRAGETVDSIVVVGGNADVAGNVRQSIVVVGGDATLRRTAVVGTDQTGKGGSVVVVGGTLAREPGATVNGETTVVSLSAPHLLIFSGLWHVVLRPGVSFGGWLGSAVFLIIVALSVNLPLGRQVDGVGKRMLHSPLPSLGWGALGAFVVLPVTGVVLILTIIGIVLVVLFAPVVLMVFLFATAVGATVLGQYLTARIWPQQQNRYFAAALGALVLSVVKLIPILGGLASTALTVAAFGATCIVFVEWQRQRKAAVAVTSAPSEQGADAEGDAAAPPPAAPATTTATQPVNDERTGDSGESA